VAVLAGVMILSALHGAIPHPRGQGSCFACETLVTPALLPPVDTCLRPPEPNPCSAPRPSQPAFESKAPRLRPLRAPPLAATV